MALIPRFMRGAYFQVIYVGLLAFCCPGIFNALNGLGKAGGSSAGAAAAANACLNACFAVAGYFGGACFNLFGNKILMCVGGLTYCFYAIGMYIAGQFPGLEWLSILSGIVLGLGAGWFWTAQGAMMMAYATSEKRGKYISTFWIIFNLGGTVGGLLSFGINFNSTEEGKANPASYFTFVAIMAAGALGGILLVPASSVIREDNEPVEFAKARGACEEIKGALSVVTHKNMQLLAILFVASNWYYTYLFNGVNGSLFTIRTRGLNAALFWGMEMLGAYALGRVLDNSRYSMKKRAFVGYGCVAFFFNLAYVLGAVLQYGVVEGGWDKDNLPSPVMDFTESKRAAFGIVCYCLYGFGDAMLQTFAYWTMGALAGDDASLCARYAGFYKGVQSAGAAIAWGLDLRVGYKVQFWICWALVLAGLGPLLFVCRNVKEPGVKEVAVKPDSSTVSSSSAAHIEPLDKVSNEVKS